MLVRPSSPPVFVYGTLMAPEVLQVLIGKIPQITQPAFVANYNRWKVKGCVFPGLTPSATKSNCAHNLEESCVQGMLLHDLESSEQDIFNWFEGNKYSLQKILVWVPASSSLLTTSMNDGLKDDADFTFDFNNNRKWKQNEAKAYV